MNIYGHLELYSRPRKQYTGPEQLWAIDDAQGTLTTTTDLTVAVSLVHEDPENRVLRHVVFDEHGQVQGQGQADAERRSQRQAERYSPTVRVRNEDDDEYYARNVDLFNRQ